MNPSFVVYHHTGEEITRYLECFGLGLSRLSTFNDALNGHRFWECSSNQGYTIDRLHEDLSAKVKLDTNRINTFSSNRINCFGNTENNKKEFVFLESIVTKYSDRLHLHYIQEESFVNQSGSKSICPESLLDLQEKLLLHIFSVNSQILNTGLPSRLLSMYIRGFLLHLKSILLIKSNVPAIALANDHHPLSVALWAVSKSLNIPTIYLQHAEISRSFPPLDFSINILRNQRSFDIYSSKSIPADNKTFILSRFRSISERKSHKVKCSSNNVNIGVFLTSNSIPNKVESLIHNLSSNPLVVNIFLKQHPRSEPRLVKYLLSLPKLHPLSGLDQIDFAICQNSSVVTELLVYGIPTFQIYDTDECLKDYYEYELNNVVKSVCLEQLSTPFWTKRSLFVPSEESINYYTHHLRVGQEQEQQRIQITRLLETFLNQALLKSSSSKNASPFLYVKKLVSSFVSLGMKPYDPLLLQDFISLAISPSSLFAKSDLSSNILNSRTGRLLDILKLMHKQRHPILYDILWFASRQGSTTFLSTYIRLFSCEWLYLKLDQTLIADVLDIIHNEACPKRYVIEMMNRLLKLLVRFDQFFWIDFVVRNSLGHTNSLNMALLAEVIDHSSIVNSLDDLNRLNIASPKGYSLFRLVNLSKKLSRNSSIHNNDFIQKFTKYLIGSPCSLLIELILDPLQSILSSQRCLLDARHSSYQLNEAKQAILGALRNNKPFSLVRLSDGEGYLFQDSSPFITEQMVFNRELHWWGENITIGTRLRICNAGKQAIKSADLLGIPSLYRLLREISNTSRNMLAPDAGHQIPSIVAIYENIKTLIHKDQVLTEELINNSLFLDKTFLSELVSEAQHSVIISSIKPSMLAKALDFLPKKPSYISIPTHNRSRRDTSYCTSAIPLPWHLDEILENMRQLVKPGTLVMVSAGIAGKGFIAEAKRLGGVALDLGHALDHLCGKYIHSFPLDYFVPQSSQDKWRNLFQNNKTYPAKFSTYRIPPCDIDRLFDLFTTLLDDDAFVKEISILAISCIDHVRLDKLEIVVSRLIDYLSISANSKTFHHIDEVVKLIAFCLPRLNGRLISDVNLSIDITRFRDQRGLHSFLDTYASVLINLGMFTHLNDLISFCSNSDAPVLFKIYNKLLDLPGNSELSQQMLIDMITNNALAKLCDLVSRLQTCSNELMRDLVLTYLSNDFSEFSSQISLKYSEIINSPPCTYSKQFWPILSKMAHQLRLSGKSKEAMALLNLFPCHGSAKLIESLQADKLNSKPRVDFSGSINVCKILNDLGYHLIPAKSTQSNPDDRRNSLFVTHTTTQDPLKAWCASKQLDGYEFYENSSHLINVATLSSPYIDIRGYVIIASLSCKNTLARALPLIIELARRGFCVISLKSKTIKSSAQSIGPLELKLLDGSFDFPISSSDIPWEIDWENRRLIHDGINYYQGIYERLTCTFRMASIDINRNPFKRKFREYLDIASRAVLCCKLIKAAAQSTDKPFYVISGNIHVSPYSIFRDCLRISELDNLSFVAIGPGYDNYYTKLGFKSSSILAINNMRLNPDKRAPFLGNNTDFEQWFAAHSAGVSLPSAHNDLGSGISQRHSDSRIIDFITSQKRLGKRIVCCYGKLLCDLAVLQDGGPAHENLIEWIIDSINTVKNDPNTVLLIKPHPHELKPQIAMGLNEKLVDIIPSSLPENVILLGNLSLSTVDIFNLVDVAMIWNGTALLELTALGLPLVAISWQALHDYPIDFMSPKDREHYEHLLLRHVFSPVPDSTRLRASGVIDYIGSDLVCLNPNTFLVPASNDSFDPPFLDYTTLYESARNGSTVVAEWVDKYFPDSTHH